MKKIPLLLLSILSLSSLAQPLEAANAQQIIDQLAPPAAPANGPTQYRTRNLKPVQRSIDLVIQFDFDSARLQSVSKPLLEQLAEAMKSERLAKMQFLIEGHTDAKGSDAYNKNLSQRRADAVQEFLKQQGINSERMATRGLGFSQLLYPEQPQAAENRRVRIIARPE